uniref:Secreted protein n=1 Tax=Ascaris lumbricoides TaxID=6252 RepID=A0A0M3IAY4_ASCLU
MGAVLVKFTSLTSDDRAAPTVLILREVIPCAAVLSVLLMLFADPVANTVVVMLLAVRAGMVPVTVVGTTGDVETPVNVESGIVDDAVVPADKLSFCFTATVAVFLLVVAAEASVFDGSVAVTCDVGGVLGSNWEAVVLR